MTRRNTSMCLLLGLTLAAACADSGELDGSDRRDDGDAHDVSAQRGTQPDASRPYFTKIVLSGSGCPEGSYDRRISPDGNSFNVSFDAFSTRVGPSTDEVMTVNCNIQADVAVPPGMEYAVVGFSYYGRADGEAGVEVRPSATYDFMGATLPARTLLPQKPLIGPFVGDGNFEVHDEAAATTPVYSGCRLVRPLRIRTQLRVINSVPKRTGGGYIGLADGSFGLTVRTEGRPCQE